MKPTNTVAKLFSSVSTLAVVAGAMACNSVAWGGGAVLAWGWNDFGECNIPAYAQSGVTAIACGSHHTLALKNGGVIAWGAGITNTGAGGWPECGQSIVPPDAQSGVAAIACGDIHSIALKNGGVIAWGRTDFGDIPADAQSGVTAIAGGYRNSIALKNSGVLVWGSNSYGECNIPVDAKSAITAIACGGGHIVALVDPSGDPDDDGIPNATDNCPSVANPTQADCDGNGVGDACDTDCNANGVPDSCEILSGAVTDINGNNIPDSCDVVSGLLNDYNHNGIADSAELIIVTTQLAVVTAQLACGDLDGSGDVGSDDLGLLLLNYGTCEGASLTTQQPQEPMIFPMPEAAKPVAVKK